MHVTLDPDELPTHPDPLAPVADAAGRAPGIDLDPDRIGLSGVEVADGADPTDPCNARFLDPRRVQLAVPPDAGAEQVREILAAATGQAPALARAWGCGEAVLEKGLGKLRSSGRNRRLNRLLNHWARRVFGGMLARRAALAGIGLREVWGGYSTTIGNMAFPAADACASAAGIARRCIAAARRFKHAPAPCSRELDADLVHAFDRRDLDPRPRRFLGGRFRIRPRGSIWSVVRARSWLNIFPALKDGDFRRL